MASELAKINDDEPDERTGEQKRERRNDARRLLDLKVNPRDLFKYDPESGIFTRKVPRAGRFAGTVGSIAGYVNPDGYVMINIEANLFRAHRLAWFFSYGEWPPNQIDHINGIRSDNRLENLRLATASQNIWNTIKVRGDVVRKGYCWHPLKGKWQARITIRKKKISLGYFLNEGDAQAAYHAAVIKYRGEYGRVS